MSRRPPGERVKGLPRHALNGDGPRGPASLYAARSAWSDAARAIVEVHVRSSRGPPRRRAAGAPSGAGRGRGLFRAPPVHHLRLREKRIAEIAASLDGAAPEARARMASDALAAAFAAGERKASVSIAGDRATVLLGERPVLVLGPADAAAAWPRQPGERGGTISRREARRCRGGARPHPLPPLRGPPGAPRAPGARARLHRAVRLAPLRLAPHLHRGWVRGAEPLPAGAEAPARGGAGRRGRLRGLLRDGRRPTGPAAPRLALARRAPPGGQPGRAGLGGAAHVLAPRGRRAGGAPLGVRRPGFAGRPLARHRLPGRDGVPRLRGRLRGARGRGGLGERAGRAGALQGGARPERRERRAGAAGPEAHGAAPLET